MEEITSEIFGAKSRGDPVHYLPSDAGSAPQDGTAVCLSGGGYRAMLFHAGVLWRLHDLGVLAKVKRISSVSGGSISAAALALSWERLYADPNSPGSFKELVINPIRKLGSHTIDRGAVLGSVFGLFGAGNRIAASYRRYLFADATLQDLPDEPRFIFNATSVQSGVLCRFSKPYLWDYRIGKIEDPMIDLAIAVAASSAFPPVLSPIILDLTPSQFVKGSGTDLELPEYQQRLILTDGGVYDNLGLETAWKRYKTILVSDAGSGFDGNPRPARDWFRHTSRVLMTIDNQVRSLRKRQVIGSLIPPNPTRTGAYWSIEDEYENTSKQPLQTPPEKTRELAAVPTRLKRLSGEIQMRLINWGYAACDRSYRRFADKGSPPAEYFPYPEVGV